jgi:hypothetical protein
MLSASIHSGFPKTGSSSLQQVLLESRDLLSGFGFFYPEGMFFPQWHCEIQRWLTNTLPEFVTGYSPLDPTLGGLDMYLRTLTQRAESQGAHTLILSCENFVFLNENEWKLLLQILKSAGVKTIKITWVSFDPEERSASWVSERIRQVEPMTSIEVQGMSAWLASALLRFRSVAEDLACDSAVTVREVGYTATVLDKLVATVVDPGVVSLMGLERLPRINASLSDEASRLLNAFNAANVEGRLYDPLAPVVFSDAFPWQRKRLELFLEVLHKLDSLESRSIDGNMG